MKRILFIALLFVNLQIVMTEDGLSFTSMTASAQDMMYEMLDEIEVEGTKVQCSYCSKRYEPDEMDSHYAVCPYKPTSCPKCGQSVLGSEFQSGSHHCYGSENTNDNGNNGVWIGGGSSGGGNGGGGIPPGGGSSGGSSGGGSSGGGSGGGSNVPVFTKFPWSIIPAQTKCELVDLNKYPKCQFSTLHLNSGVHLVQSTLAVPFQKQKVEFECVARAIATVASMNFGASYENALQIVTQTAEENGIDFNKEGIPLAELNKAVKDYGAITSFAHDAQYVQSLIDDHKAVMGMLKTTRGYHMVTIFGYDSENYYCAVGYEDPICLPKSLFNERPIIELLEKKSYLKCRRL